MSKIRSFEVLVGLHNQDGKDYKTGDVVRTHLDLGKMFAFKFKEIETPVAVAAASIPSQTAPVAEGSKTASGAYVESESALGEDVSPSFPQALAADYRVFKKGKKFFVAEPPKLDEALNDKGLSEDEVAEFVADLLK